MAFRGGSSLSRSLISAVRSSPSLPSLPRSPPLRNLAPATRRSLFSLPANVGQLACAQSLLPLHSAVSSVRMTSHIAAESRAFCELSQGGHQNRLQVVHLNELVSFPYVHVLRVDFLLEDPK